jgi:paraquat-inducible protein B
VRDLLFGTQLRDVETRFQRNETRFQREVNDAREALKARLDSLENFMRSETAALAHRMNTEAAERDAAMKAEQRERFETLNKLAGNIAAAEEAFERRIAALSSTLDNTGQEIRKLMQSETNSLNNKIDEKYTSALNVISETATHIRNDMIHRSSLSNMFTEMAVKLSNQWAADLREVTIGENQEGAFENQEYHQPHEERD